jgi:phospholipid N-methyltransferase
VIVSISDRLRFMREYARNPNTVGAVAPSSQALAEALCEPYQRFNKPARILEVGAGTGPITRHLGSILRPTDHLDVCEIQDDLADVLQKKILTEKYFGSAISEDRVHLLRMPIQDIKPEAPYDFVISGLPLTAFALRDIRDVLRIIQRNLTPNGVLSYFEYVGLRRLTRMFTLGRQRAKIRMVSAYLSRNIRVNQVSKRVVLHNLPPAHARHFRFHEDSVTPQRDESVPSSASQVD